MINYNEIVKSYSKLNILVIGDIMLDRFIWGNVERISPEAPVPIVKVTNENLLLGGAANVLNNIVSLGGKADICGVIGNDIFGDYILKLLKEKKISSSGIIIEEGKSTIVKTRVIGQKQQIVRVDREDPKKLKQKSLKKIIDFIGDNIKNYNAIILSDYGKGLVINKFYKSILKIAKDNKKIFNIDPKNSNMNIYKYPTLLTPNINEASYAANKKITMQNIKSIGKKLLRKFVSDYLLITLGEKGMALFQKDSDVYEHIPTMAREVYDVTGAGDTVISVLTMTMALGVNISTSAKISNIAAGLVVGKVGTATVSQEELLKNLHLSF